MGSDAAKKKKLQAEKLKKEKLAAKFGLKKKEDGSDNEGSGSGDDGSGGEDGGSGGDDDDGEDGGEKKAAAKKDSSKGKKPAAKKDLSAITAKLEDLEISNRAVTGVLSSHPKGRDIHVENYSLSFFGQMLIEDTRLELNFGRRYGLLGYNGSGKSTFLKSLSSREVPIPRHIDIFHLDGEAKASDLTAMQAVLESVNDERALLEKEMEEIMSDESQAAYMETLSERLDELDPDVVEARAAKILHGLGFSKATMEKKTREFSGGWRMRISLAKALFVSPMLLILDEPTNHLDLEACVWLEEFLKNYKRILVVVSHSQDFLNGVCTNIIHLWNRRLLMYTGNYDSFVKTRAEIEENQTKRYEKEQEEIRHMKEYIARFGHGSAKLAKQAQSKEKTMARMIENGLTEEVVKERAFNFAFPLTDILPPPVLQFVDVSFGYSPGKEHELYRKLDFGVDQDTRVAIVGPNGVGKSTLLKLITGENVPTDGVIRRHNKLRLGFYHQHLVDLLDPELCPLEWFLKTFPQVKEEEAARRTLGRYGTTGKTQTQLIGSLSDGQKSRIAFAYLSMLNSHIMLLDEPTNHLDLETIDSLADAIAKWNGGVILVSHDFRLIDKVAKDIWVAENKTLRKWEGDIVAYKDHLKKGMGIL